MTTPTALLADRHPVAMAAPGLVADDATGLWEACLGVDSSIDRYETMLMLMHKGSSQRESWRGRETKGIDLLARGCGARRCTDGAHQHAAQRSADRAEERRQSIATTELRRAEQVQAIKDFFARVQDAERAAYTRPEPWGADEDGWMTTAQTVMTKLWAAARGVALLYDAALDASARAYGCALNQALWRETGDLEVNEHLEERGAAPLLEVGTAGDVCPTRGGLVALVREQRGDAGHIRPCHRALGYFVQGV
ncbi:hypothetical protein ACH4UR_08640 [Streptomyces lydicus]|uniref:hypothetical protein n=1 Tax=Streptomyces lydicus TaxID=47763 RepID=UPI0033D97207